MPFGRNLYLSNQRHLVELQLRLQFRKEALTKACLFVISDIYNECNSYRKEYYLKTLIIWYNRAQSDYSYVGSQRKF